MRKHTRHLCGVLCAFAVVLLWTLSSFLVKAIGEEGDYYKPFFLTYCSTISLQAYYLTLIKWPFLKKKGREKGSCAEAVSSASRPLNDEEALVGSQSQRPPELGTNVHNVALRPGNDALLPQPDSTHQTVTGPQLVPSQDEPVECAAFQKPTERSRTNASDISNASSDISRVKMFKIVSAFLVVYFLSNYLTNYALYVTPTDTASILLSTSTFFIIIIGAFSGIELLNGTKIAAILISVFGAILLASMESGSSPLYGNIASIVSALLYGVYSVGFTIIEQRCEGKGQRIDMKLFFALMGTISMLALWPFFIILNFTQFETFEKPSLTVVICTVVNIVFGSFVPNYLWVVAMKLTTPGIVAATLSLNIPVAMIGQYIQSRNDIPTYVIPTYKWFSAGCVVIGFFLLNIDTMCDKSKRHFIG